MSGPDLTPPSNRDLPAIERRRAALVRELRAPQPSRWHRRQVLLVPAGLLVTGGAAWAAGVFGAPVKDITTVVCRAEAQRGARSVRLPSTLSGRLPDSATEVCLAVPKVAASLGYMRGGTTRPLVSCRGERQAVVVPGEDTEAACASLGLDSLSAGAFRAEVHRQVDAYRLAAALFPDPDEQRLQDPGEGPDCIVAGTLRRRAEAVLRDRDFEDFSVRLASGGRASDCTADVTVSIDSDGRTIQIDTDGAPGSSARRSARNTLAEPACRRLRREGRLDRPGDLAVLGALECVDAELLAERGSGLSPADAPAAVRGRLGLEGWKTVVKVPRGSGVTQFETTAVDRRRHTIEVGFALRRIVAPGARRPASRDAG